MVLPSLPLASRHPTTEPPTSPPLNLDLLGLNLTIGHIDLELSAHTGQGLILGNLLYNVSNLLNSGSSLSTLLHLLALLA